MFFSHHCDLKLGSIVDHELRITSAEMIIQLFYYSVGKLALKLKTVSKVMYLCCTISKIEIQQLLGFTLLLNKRFHTYSIEVET